MKNWRRDDWFDETGAAVDQPVAEHAQPDRRRRSIPGIGAIEGTNISVGRGTDTPFEQLGAPWIDGLALADALNARRIPGIRFYPVRFTPTASKYSGQECQGVFMIVTDRAALRPVRVGSKSRRRSSSCTARSSSSKTPSGCSDLTTASRASAPGRIRRRLPHRGQPPRRGGVYCVRPISFIAELCRLSSSCHPRQICEQRAARSA